MKNIYISVLIAAFSLNLFSQLDSVMVLDSTYSYNWDKTGNDWAVFSRTVYGYDANGNKSESIKYDWDSETNEWECNDVRWCGGFYCLGGRHMYNYDLLGNITEHILYGWDLPSSDWIEFLRSTIEYDNNGNLSKYNEFEWDSLINDWSGTWRKTTTYDDNGNQTEYIYYKWDSGTNDWIFGGKTVSYWSELKTSVSNSIDDLNCAIYPNPTREIITIETDRFDQYSIHITTLNGQFIYSTEIKGTAIQVNLSSFPKGVYCITIRSNKNVSTRKIMKL